ncbi:MAG: class C sortase, partial [Lactococcus plantarum]|nr:class C sortase [Lactococcus plantarum]
RYDFVFYAVADGQGIANLVFYLVEKKGKISVLRDGERLKAVSDKDGRVLFEAIPGGRYVANPEQQTDFPKVSGFVRLLHDQHFTLKSRGARVKRIGKQHHRDYIIDRGRHAK